MSKPLSYLLAALVLAASAHAAAQAPPHEPSALPADDAPLLLSTDSGAERFQPVGSFRGQSQCTATLIAGAHPPADDVPALILTAGHCVGSFHTNDVVTDVQAPSDWNFTPAYFIDTQAQHKSFKIHRTLYATMKGIDVAILELDADHRHPDRPYPGQWCS
jgi:hypothetical protein